MSCLKRADGDQIRADKMQDKGYWEYYWDLENYNRYCEDLKTQHESRGNNANN